MQILEAIRSHPPPLLHELDPVMPAELGQVVAGALTRNRQQRFAELGTVRRELDGIRRRLVEESNRLAWSPRWPRRGGSTRRWSRRWGTSTLRLSRGSPIAPTSPRCERSSSS
ncbi:MAG: hypothetical protein ACRELZ_05115 [Candidatus Rokuibacteriota bacterium]